MDTIDAYLKNLQQPDSVPSNTHYIFNSNPETIFKAVSVELHSVLDRLTIFIIFIS